MDNKSGGEEEFKFVDDQNTSAFQSAAKINPTVSGMNPNRKKRLFIIIGGIIALFCLYKLYGLFSSTPSPHNKPEMPAAVATVTPEVAKPAVVEAPAPEPTPVSTPEPAPIPEAAPATTPPTPPADNSAEMLALNDQVSSLGQMINTDRMAIQDLQSQIATLSSTINNFQGQLTTVQQAKETKVVEEQKPVVKKKVVVKQKPKPVVVSTYYVKAMIQGRAWLTTTDGATFTVTENQNLPGYGTVENIDPSDGVVMTSSGKVIAYPPEDR